MKNTTKISNEAQDVLDAIEDSIAIRLGCKVMGGVQPNQLLARIGDDKYVRVTVEDVEGVS